MKIIELNSEEEAKPGERERERELIKGGKTMIRLFKGQRGTEEGVYI